MMNEAIVEKVKALITAPSCYAGLKKIAEEYIAALGSDREKEAGRKLVAELEADVLSIDDVLAFLNRMQGKNIWRGTGGGLCGTRPGSESEGRQVVRLSCLCAGKRDSGQERGALLKHSNHFMKRENIREAGTLFLFHLMMEISFLFLFGT